MKIVHAIWEKRNLGVDCNEITIETSDNVSEVKNRMKDYERQYTVVKVPSSMYEICNVLQDDNFKYMETVINCYNKVQLPILDSVQERIVKSLSYMEMNDIDLEELFCEVENDMFETDRISMDVNFTSEQTNKRYIGWITDEIQAGSKVFKLVYKDSSVGFFILKNKDNGKFVAVLGGIYKKFKSFGFGFCMNYFQISECINQNGSKVYNTFSTNNKGASAVHFSMNYFIDSIYNVFVKHKDNCE